MALSQEDLSALGSFIKTEVSDGLTALRDEFERKLETASAPAPENHGQPDAANDTASAPEYYVHLANGDVITSKDSASTHMTVDGKSVVVIGRYAVGE